MTVTFTDRALRLRGKRIQLLVDLLVFAPEDLRERAAVCVCEVRAGVLDLVGGVKDGAVVDPDRVGVFVFDDRAVHERAEVPAGVVVQVGAGDPGGDRLGQPGGDLVHVGQPAGHRDRDLLAGGTLGDALADRVRERELAA